MNRQLKIEIGILVTALIILGALFCLNTCTTPVMDEKHIEQKEAF